MAPFTVNVAAWPVQMEVELTVIAGAELTVTIDKAVFTQPADVPVTV